MDAEKVAITFTQPGNHYVVGPSMIGKSHFVRQLLLNHERVFEKPFDTILYCYKAWNEEFQALKDALDILTFYKGFPTREMLEEIYQNGTSESNHCLVIDDYGLEASSSREALDVFLVHTHHFRFTTLYLNQSMYGGGKYARTIALNMNYITVFAIPRDKDVMRYLGRQVFGEGGGRFLQEAHHFVTKNNPRGYLCIDLTPHCPDLYKVCFNFRFLL